MKVRVVAARINDRGASLEKRPILIGSYDLEGPINHVLWGMFGPSWARYEDGVVEIVKAYGVIEYSRDNYGEWEKFEKKVIVDYNETFPIFPDDPSLRIVADAATGWIAPDGKYFHCLYGEHRDEASALHEALYPGEEGKGLIGSDQFLEDRKWAKVQHGEIFVKDYDLERLTPAQKRTLSKLMGACTDDVTARRLAVELRRAAGEDVDWDEELGV